jgi:hypothetical protein
MENMTWRFREQYLPSSLSNLLLHRSAVLSSFVSIPLFDLLQSRKFHLPLSCSSRFIPAALLVILLLNFFLSPSSTRLFSALSFIQAQALSLSILTESFWLTHLMFHARSCSSHLITCISVLFRCLFAIWSSISLLVPLPARLSISLLHYLSSLASSLLLPPRLPHLLSSLLLVFISLFHCLSLALPCPSMSSHLAHFYSSSPSQSCISRHLFVALHPCSVMYLCWFISSLSFSTLLAWRLFPLAASVHCPPLFCIIHSRLLLLLSFVTPFFYLLKVKFSLRSCRIFLACLSHVSCSLLAYLVLASVSLVFPHLISCP